MCCAYAGNLLSQAKMIAANVTANEKLYDVSAIQNVIAFVLGSRFVMFDKYLASITEALGILLLIYCMPFFYISLHSFYLSISIFVFWINNVASVTAVREPKSAVSTVSQRHGLFGPWLMLDTVNLGMIDIIVALFWDNFL